MLRVMLVDDERMALEGLRLLVDWEKEGFEVCASHINGSDALADIPRVRPDLIVTDLRMPETDGLMLMARARESGYDGQFLIVSGYGDFAMAQQAMQYKVAGYLLKPIDPSEVVELLEPVRAQLIARELYSRPDVPTYHQALTLLLGGQPVPQGVLPAGGQWRLLTWGAPLPYERGSELLAPLRAAGATASAHIIDGLEWIALHWADGLPAPELEPMRQALLADRRQLMLGVATSDIATLRTQEQTLCDTYRVAPDRALALAAQLIEAVSLRDTDESLRLADELQALCDACGMGLRQQVWQALIAGFTRQLADRPERAAELVRAEADGFGALSLVAIHLLAPETLRVSDQVIRYADAHYASRSLTLAGVAHALGYNATYLGRLFREETGTGFRDWLNALRVQKAAALLAATEETVYQIAETVGYPQYKQFLQHFKARYHTTPEQYRRSLTP